jgi:hypothetical protein
MKFLKYICLLVIGFAFIIGCSGDYGKLRFQTDTEEKMTLAELRKNREDYHVYWCTRAYHIPVAIMFDPKNDETRIVGDSWIKISDQQTLSETIETIQSTQVNREVVIIEGPDGRFFGYMYYTFSEGRILSPGVSAPLELVDERTLYVGSATGSDIAQPINANY